LGTIDCKKLKRGPRHYIDGFCHARLYQRFVFDPSKYPSTVFEYDPDTSNA
jgi:hypothetical protein